MADSATITTNLVVGQSTVTSVVSGTAITATVATGGIGATGSTGATGPGVPTGGTANQVLAKIDSTNYNTQWVAQTGGGSTTSASVTKTVGPANADYITTGASSGTTDDVQIAAACAAVIAAGGGTVFIQPKSIPYNIKARIRILGSNLIVRGGGIGATVLKLANGVDQEIFVVGNGNNNDTAAGDAGGGVGTPCNDVYFEDLTVDGNKANQTAQTSWTPYATSATRNLIRFRSDAQSSYGGGCTRVSALNGIQNGLSCESHANGAFINCRAENCDQSGMWAENGSQWGFISNYTRNNGQNQTIGGSGIRVASFGGFTITGNQMKGDRGQGLVIQSSSDGTVTANAIYRAGWQGGAGDAASAGIYSSVSNNIVIANNSVFASQGHGIVINGNECTTITANTLRRNGQFADNTYSDIYVTYENGGSGNHRNVISANTFQNDTATFYTNKAKYNLSADSPTAHYNNIIESNNFDAPGTAKVFNLFTDNTFSAQTGVQPQAVHSYGFATNPLTIDPKDGQFLYATGYYASTAVTITAGSYKGQSFMFLYNQDTGGKQLTWTNATFAGSAPPTFTGTNVWDMIWFTWNGSSWYGHVSANPDLLALKAPVASPALTGTPTAPTAAALTNSTQLATTAYADGAITAERTTTRTLSGARLTLRTSTITSSVAPTPNGDTDDRYTITALAVGATFGAPTGTPTDGQKLIIRVKDNGAAQTLAFNTIYRFSSNLAGPTTTILSKTLYMGFAYNTADSKWDCLAILTNF